MRSGNKTFEVRKNDRGYQPGDLLVLHEWDQATQRYSGNRIIAGPVTFIGYDLPGLQNGYVAMCFAELRFLDA